MRRTLVAGTAGTIAAAGLMVGAPPASADLERERTKACTGPGWATLSVEQESANRLEVDFEVERARPGNVWKVRVAHDGQTVLRTQRVADYEGDVDVIHSVADRPGADRVKVVARTGKGEVCRVAIRL